MRIGKGVIDAVLIALIGVWAASIIWDMTHPDYEPPTGVYEMAMLAAGFLFGGKRLLNGNGNDVRNSDSSDDRDSVPDSRIRTRRRVGAKDALAREHDGTDDRDTVDRHGTSEHDSGGGVES